MSPSFSEVGVPADLVDHLRAGGITEPFPIQAATLPDALAGHDICGGAPTGSGKTIAFGIPVVLRVARADRGRPRALILVPTRELADQVRRELEPLARLQKRRVAAFYGGVGYKPQLDALRRGVDIAVACPGRLEDLISRGDMNLADVDTVVLDEADRMADMGFLPAVRRILDQTNDNRQTLLFSATLDGDIDPIIKRYQHKPRRHLIADDETDWGDVTHHFWAADRHQRTDLTADVIRRQWPAIIFVRTRHGADRLAKRLNRDGVDAAAIHGNRSQSQRTRALDSFSRGKVQALVATDVAARGIHVDEVNSVVHFDPPGDSKDYIHRSGRTGRAGADGIVVSMIDPSQVKATKKMQRQLELQIGVVEADPSSLGRSDRPTRPSGGSGTPSSRNRSHADRSTRGDTHREEDEGRSRSDGRKKPSGASKGSSRNRKSTGQKSRSQSGKGQKSQGQGGQKSSAKGSSGPSSGQKRNASKGGSPAKGGSRSGSSGTKNGGKPSRAQRKRSRAKAARA